MIVQMAFCLWVDLRKFTCPNQILLDLWTNLVSVLYGYLDMCCKVTWSSLFAFTQHCLSLIVSRAVSAFSGVMLQLFVGVLRPSPGWEKAKVTDQSESLRECTCRLKEERLLISNWCSLRGIVCMYISLLPAFPLFLNLFQVWLCI